MKKLYLFVALLVTLSACQTKYLTPEGERLVGNVAAGCVFGEVFFDDCKAGAAVTGAATIIDGQNWSFIIALKKKGLKTTAF